MNNELMFSANSLSFQHTELKYISGTQV